MAFQGWLSFGGTEIANAPRVESYVRNLLPGFPLRGCQGCDSLTEALGDEPYASPLQDGAPWVDPANTATYDFLGFYPVRIEGLDSATTTTEVVQSVGFGGYNNIPRDGTREIRVQGVLVASTHLGLEAGMTWLREALRPGLCGDHGGSCVGSDLCYYAACPELTVCYTDDSTEGGPSQLDNVAVASGPVMVMNTFDADARIDGTIIPAPASDGFTFNWGVSQLVGDVSNIAAAPVDSYGPVTPQRTNVIANPHFTVGITLWTTSSGVLTRVAGTAPDGGDSGHFVPTGTGLLSTSIEAAPFGQNMLSFQLRTPSGASTFTVNIRSALDNSLVQTQVFSTTTDWSPYTLALPFARGNVLEFASTETFDLTTVMVEGGTAQMPYFDGSTLPAMPSSKAVAVPTPEYEVSWLGAPNASASRMVWRGVLSFAFCGEGLYAWVQALSGSGTLSATWDSYARVSAEEQASKYERSMHDVVILSGPLTTQELATDVGVGRVVEFLLSAANPYAYSTARDLLMRFPLDSLPVQTWVDIVAPEEQVTIIVDPDCPPLPTPPSPPSITNSCVDGPGVWDRYSYVIPADEVSSWSLTLPTIGLNSGSIDVRQVRARLTPNPFNYPVATANRLNLSTNPSGEVSTAGWTAIPGATGVAAVTNPTATTAFGAKVLRTTWTTASTAAGGGMSGTSVPVLPGSFHSFRFGHVKASIVTRLVMAVDWYNGASYLSTTTDGTPFVTAAATVYSKQMLNLVAPATATRAVPKVISITGTSYANWSIASTLELDGLMANEGATILDYFDGDTPDAAGWFYGWEGAVGLSSSLGQQSVIDPYSYCGEFILSYLPADAELVVDGALARSWASVGGAPSIPASNLLYGTDGTPIVWPQLTCGIPYLLTVDVPVGTGDELLLSLALTRRE